VAVRPPRIGNYVCGQFGALFTAGGFRATVAHQEPPRHWLRIGHVPRRPTRATLSVVCVRGALAPREPLREVRASQEIFASTHTHTAYRTSDNRPTRILKTGRQGCT
jgi:hypothetical protein